LWFLRSFIPQQGEHGRGYPVKKAQLEQDFRGDNAKMQKENTANKEDARGQSGPKDMLNGAVKLARQLKQVA
jgi:hypothetical protein